LHIDDVDPDVDRLVLLQVCAAHDMSPVVRNRGTMISLDIHFIDGQNSFF
jgi:hypothetical protein